MRKKKIIKSIGILFIPFFLFSSGLSAFAQNINYQDRVYYLSPKLLIHSRSIETSFSNMLDLQNPGNQGGGLVAKFSNAHNLRNAELKDQIEQNRVILIISQSENYQAYPLLSNMAPINLPEKKMLDVHAALLLAQVKEKLIRARESDFLKFILAQVDHFSDLSVEQKNKLIVIVQNAPLFVVKGRITLHERGAFAHTRRGTYANDGSLDDSGFWIGELALRELESAEIALLFLEEAQHILFPKAEHGQGIYHDSDLYQKLADLAKKHIEEAPEFFCEADMLSMNLNIGLSLRLESKLMFKQKIDQILEQSLIQTLKMEDINEDITKYLEKVIPKIWAKAVKAKRIMACRRFKAGKFEYAVLKKEDYAREGKFASLLRESQAMAFPGRSNGHWFLLVDGDFVPEQFIEYVAIHEFGHQILSNNHHLATKLEFAAVAEDGKMPEYLSWLKEKNLEKFGDVFSHIEKVISAEKFKKEYWADISTEYQDFMEEASNQAVEKIERFELPDEVKELAYLFESSNKKIEDELEYMFQAVYRVIPDTISSGTNLSAVLSNVDSILRIHVEKLANDPAMQFIILERIRIKLRDLDDTWGLRLHKTWYDYETQALEVLLESTQPGPKLKFLQGASIDISKILNIFKAEHLKLRKLALPDIKDKVTLDVIIEQIKDDQDFFFEYGELKYLNDISVREIAEQIGLSEATIRASLKKSGVQYIAHKGKEYPLDLLIPGKKYVEYQTNDILRAWLKKGMSLVEIENMSEELIAQVAERCNSRHAFSKKRAQSFIDDFIKKISSPEALAPKIVVIGNVVDFQALSVYHINQAI